MKAVTLCIINYNGLDYLKQAFAALRDFRDQFAEILVIDNNSSDGSLAYLRSLTDVSVIANDHNPGPGGARNTGFINAQHDLILFQDNDVELNVHTAQRLLDALQSDSRVLAVAPRVLYRQSPDLIQYDSANCHTLGLMSIRHADRPAAETPADCLSTSSLVTACFLIDRSHWRSGVLFDETLIFNLEDHDFGVRANMFGYTLLVNEHATVIHGAGTGGLSWRPGYALSSKRLYCLIRNRWWILLRYYSTRTLLILLPYLILFEWLQLLAAILKGHPGTYPAAVFSTLRRLPTLLRQRRQFQRQRRKADAQILRPGPLPLTSAMRSGGIAGWIIGIFERSLERYSHFTGLHQTTDD